MEKSKRGKWLVYISLSSLFTSLALLQKNPLYGVSALLFAIAALIIAVKNKPKK